MNITDARGTDVNGDRLRAMFARQHELMLKYREIERKNGVGSGLLPERFSFDDARCQAVMKDYAWRVTEEIAEATEALPNDLLHTWEEVADAVHFMIELLMLAEIVGNDFAVGNTDTDTITDIWSITDHLPMENPTQRAYIVVETLGLAMNCLKNKPWKQTQMETDVVKFKRLLKESFIYLMAFARSVGMTHDSVVEIYFKKSEVNKFRQRSQY